MNRVQVLVIAVLFSILSGACERTPSIEGHWVGVLNQGTEDHRRFEVDIARFRDRWIAEIDDDQGLTDYPVRIEMPSSSEVILTLRPGVMYRGRLAADRSSLDGELVVDDVRVPLVMTRKGRAEISQNRIDFESLPPGTVRLTVLSADSHELKRDFNRDRSKVRFVSLLSPT